MSQTFQNSSVVTRRTAIRNRLIASVLGIVLCVLGAGSAFAAGSYANYNVTLPKFGGTTSTNNRAKAAASNGAVICSTTVGADYYIDGRIEDVSNNVVADWKSFSTAMRVDYTYSSATTGAYYHARLGNKWNTPVDVQAQGKWSPDNPGGC